MMQTATRDTVLPPAMDGRNRRFDQAGHGGRTSEGVDHSACGRFHSSQHPIIGTLKQAKTSDNGNCDNRNAGLYGLMEVQDIKRLMRERGYKQVDLANLLDVMPNKISKSFSGERRFTVEEMDKIRDWLGAAAVAGGEGVRMLPIIGQVAAGHWSEAIKTTANRMPAPEPDLHSDAFVLEVQGDSMDKLVEDGGVVIVDPSDKALFPGRFYVIQDASGDATFKQFADAPARLVPCSNNPAHKDITIGSGEGFTVIGRVVWRAARM